MLLCSCRSVNGARAQGKLPEYRPFAPVDRVIDMGPEGGDGGGEVVAEGTPEQLARLPKSYAGRCLKPALAKKGEERAPGGGVSLRKGLRRSIDSRRKPILAAPLESGQPKPRKAKEDHRPGRQFGDGLRAAHDRSRSRSWAV
jgi:hypothetical protein